MPRHPYHGALIRLDLMPHLTRLPIPKADIAARIARDDELAVGRDVHVDGVPGVVLPAETLLAVLAEAVGGGVDDDLVVPALEGDGFAVGVRGRAHHGVHVGFRDVFDGHGDVVFPCAQGFVVRGGDEAAVVVAEGDGVDRLEVVVVFLGHFAGTGVELDDLLVRGTDEERVGVCGRVEAEDVGDGFGWGLEARCAGTGFGVP